MDSTLEAQVEDLRHDLAGLSALEIIRAVTARFPGRVSFSTSFGIEDQALSHLIFAHELPVRVFTLDTGRNFQETYSTWNKTLLRYGQRIEAFAPLAASVEELVTQKGPNSFYESLENRKECCYIRKVEPLVRALAGTHIWLTGIRAEQSANRQNMHAVEWDASHQLIKVHPLFEWTWAETVAFTQQNGVPTNPLHQQGFVSIGCAPCTRAIKPGEDFRAGRWWWENPDAKECGLHDTTAHQGLGPVVEQLPN